jgi:hypothetical protein
MLATLSYFYDYITVDVRKGPAQSEVQEKTLEREHSSVEAQMLLDPMYCPGREMILSTWQQYEFLKNGLLCTL